MGAGNEEGSEQRLEFLRKKWSTMSEYEVFLKSLKQLQQKSQVVLRYSDRFSDELLDPFFESLTKIMLGENEETNIKSKHAIHNCIDDREAVFASISRNRKFLSKVMTNPDTPRREKDLIMLHGKIILKAEEEFQKNLELIIASSKNSELKSQLQRLKGVFETEIQMLKELHKLENQNN